jgi:hypothetical protein
VTAGAVLLLVGNVTTALFAGGSPIGVGVAMGFTGLGYALIQTPLLSTASQLVTEEQTSSGLGLFMMLLFIGGGTGVAIAVTTVELQGPGASSWVGLDRPQGAQYSNAALALSVYGLTALALLPMLPDRALRGTDAREIAR